MLPTEHTTGRGGRPLHAPRPALPTRERYLVLPGWAFTCFSSVRALTVVLIATCRLAPGGAP